MCIKVTILIVFVLFLSSFQEELLATFPLPTFFVFPLVRVQRGTSKTHNFFCYGSQVEQHIDSGEL